MLIDLQGSSPEASEMRVYDMLRNYRWLGDSGRVVVVDDVVSLVDHHSIYETIQSSTMVRLVCVAVGPPANRPGGTVIKATKVLDNDDAATLWVGDRTGASWPAGPAQDLGDEPDDSALRVLLDALTLPKVFDRVVELARVFPGRVANPGYLVVAGQVGPANLHSARHLAMDTLAGGGDRPRRRQLPPDADIDLLLGTSGSAGVARDRLREGSRLHHVHRDCTAAWQLAQSAVVRLANPGAPWMLSRSPDVEAALDTVGSAVADLRAVVTDMFREGGARSGMEDTTRQELEQWGVVLDAVPGTDRASLVDRLRGLVEDSLGRGYSCGALANWLRRQAERVEPVGSVGRTVELEEACPSTVVDRLRQPPRFPWNPRVPWLLGTAGAVAAVAALGPFGGLTGPALAVLWTCLIGLTTRAQPGQVPSGAVSLALLWHLIAAGIGCAVGLAVDRAVPLSPVVGVVLVVAALVTAAVAIRVAWVGAVHRWCSQLDLPGARRGIDAVPRLVCDVALREWVLGDARRFVAETALVVGRALDDVAGALSDAARSGHGRTTPISLELQELTDFDLARLVVRALEPSWDRLTLAPGGDSRFGLRERVHDLLDTYSRNVELHGLDGALGPEPPSARDELVRALWRESPVINRLMLDVAPDSRMHQLCTPEDLPLLDQVPAHFRVVRFAPSAAQAALVGERGTSRHAHGEIEWTAAGHIAGLIRLVPLRDGAVELTWPASIGEQDVL